MNMQSANSPDLLVGNFETTNFDSSPESSFLSPITGEISTPKTGSTKDAFDTLDEPVLTTISRDLKAIGQKFLHVLFPRKSQALLRDWDLWGPLFLCVFISLLLQGSHGSAIDEKGPEFTEMFALTWFGACAVTLNVKLLRGSISFFQSLCVLGYCLLSPAVALLICKATLLADEKRESRALFVVRLIVTAFGFGWATFASTAFLSGYSPARKKALVIYPMFLFYFVISWLILSHT